MKETIFISSTFEDLKSHRQKVWDLLEKYDVNVRGMEKFGARKETTLSTCLSEIEQSDIYVAIIAHRLGTIEEGIGKSYTQIEYERAYELNKELLIYLIDEKDAMVSLQNIDFEPKREKLLAFKSILKDRHTIDSFVSEDDLAEKLGRRLNDLLATKEVTDGVDEYSKTKNLVKRFLLTPALYSGREIKLRIDFRGDPFPASKAICSSFNLSYGKTICLKATVKQPKLEQDVFEYVFIDQDTVDDFLSLPDHNNVAVFGKLQFSENKVEDFKANFVRREYQTMSASILSTFALGSGSYGGLSQELSKQIYGDVHIEDAEGTVILQVTRIPKERQ